MNMEYRSFFIAYAMDRMILRGNSKVRVVIGNAWPYANGSLHIGRVSSWLAGDVLARYHRAKGDEVVFVSGSDCHGSPILNRAKELNESPEDLINKYHREFIRCFNRLGFSFDIFTRTDTKYHEEQVKNIIKDLYKKGFIYEKETEEFYCSKCCDTLDEFAVKDGLCKECKTEVEVRKSNNLFFKLSYFQGHIQKILNEEEGWRENAIKITKRYLDGGLRDKILTREIDWGIEVPIEGFEDKRVYVWIDALLAYVTSSKKFIEEKGEELDNYWNDEEGRVYLVHGKENIPFHTTMFPAMLAGIGLDKGNIRIVSSQYLTLEGKTFSTNRNWAIWVPYIIERYNIDSIRYYLISRGAEEKNSDFTWRDFINANNNELLGELGNFINRVLIFIRKNFNGEINGDELPLQWRNLIRRTYVSVGNKFENGEFKSGINEVFNLIKQGNDFFDKNKPWILINKDRKRCEEIIYICAQIVIALTDLMNPIIPFTCEKIRNFLKLDNAKWSFEERKNIKVTRVELLFDRIDKKIAIEELNRLKSKKI